MGFLSNPLFGTPKDHAEKKAELEVVKLPEFDITQYGKKLGLILPGFLGAGAGALAVFEDKDISDPVIVGLLALAAAMLLGTSFVMAVDVAARAYLTGGGAAKEKEKKEKGGANGEADTDSPPAGKPGSTLIPLPAGAVVWLQGERDPHPLLAMASDGKEVSSYLVATGGPVDRARGAETVQAIDGTPTWQGPEKVRAVKPAKWP